MILLPAIAHQRCDRDGAVRKRGRAQPSLGHEVGKLDAVLVLVWLLEAKELPENDGVAVNLWPAWGLRE